MLRIKALRSFGLGGGAFAVIGETLELSDADANARVRQGKAIFYKEEVASENAALKEIKEIKGGKKK